MIRAIDFCCGAGGWAAAARGLPIEFVAVADQADDCLETWQLNHGAAHPGCALIKADLSTPAGLRALRKAAKKVDLVLGAIPCEQISHIRANRPLKDGEIEGVHNLIDLAFELVAKLKPRWWCFEDVTQVEAHLPLPIMTTVRYECVQIDASLYGPQKRLRTFFGRFPAPAEPEPGPRLLADVLRPGPFRTLPQLARYKRSKSKWYGGDLIRVQDPEAPGATVISSQGGMGSRAERSGMVPLARVLDPDEPAPTVTQMGAKGDRSCLIGARARNLDAEAPAPTVTASYYCDPRTMPLFARERPQAVDEPSRAVISGHGGRDMSVADEGLVRVMEWQEAAALQGFPSDYIFAASWSRTWKLVAQAIPIYVGRAILRSLVERND